MATTVRLADVDEALGRCQLLLDKYYRNNEDGSGVARYPASARLEDAHAGRPGVGTGSAPSPG